jgi:hypothetical protein
MTDENSPEPPAPPPEPPQHFEKSARDAIIGSAQLDAQPINVAPEAPTEVPQALIGTPEPPAPGNDQGGSAEGAG